MDDAGDGTRWMLYSELAMARGISRASATRLAFRKHWPRRTGNDGQARVAVPPDAQVSSPADVPVAIPGDMGDIVAGSSNGNGLTREKERANWAEAARAADAALLETLHAQVMDLTARLDRAEAREAELLAAAERQWRELTATGLRTGIVETEALALREALAEARRPAWRRWLGLT